MPRSNKEPFNCAECRFNNNGFCMRNPPSAVQNVHYATMNTTPSDCEPRIGVIGLYPPALHGCFAGEPTVEQSCNNCEHFGHVLCPLDAAIGYTPDFRKDVVFYCNCWEIEK